MTENPPLPVVPATCRKPVKPEDQPTQADKDDLELVAQAVGECGTKAQVARAYKALWKILQETKQ